MEKYSSSSPQPSSGTFDALKDTLIDVKGKVVDEKGEPLAGVNVVVKGTGKGTTTNGNGEFTLKNVDEASILEISSVGYETRGINVNGKRSSLSIVLNNTVSNLDDVQIIAYGTTTRRFNTGNVSTVKAEDIEKQPVNNPLLALQGRVPGLFITQLTGIPGGGVTVRIQGQNSISRMVMIHFM